MAASVKYVGDEDETEVFGHTVKADKPLNKHTLTPHQLAILHQNPQFEVTGFEPDKDDAKAQAEAAKPVEQRGSDKPIVQSPLDGEHNDARG